MAWFRNYYQCERCDNKWADDWSSKCDDDCPACGARHMTPSHSDDMGIVIEPAGGGFVVRRSSPAASDAPEYETIACFESLKEAEAYRLAFAKSPSLPPDSHDALLR
jgi:hypothetical protein